MFIGHEPGEDGNSACLSFLLFVEAAVFFLSSLPLVYLADSALNRGAIAVEAHHERHRPNM